MRIEQLPATTIHHPDMTEKLFKAALNSKHKLLPYSFIQKIGHNLTGSPLILFPTNHIMLYILIFPLLFGIYMGFPVFWLLSGISMHRHGVTHRNETAITPLF